MLFYFTIYFFFYILKIDYCCFGRLFMKKILFIILLQFLIIFQIQAQFFGSDNEIPEVDVIFEVIPNEILPGESFTVFATYIIPDDYHMFLNKELFNIFLINNTDNFTFDKTIFPMDEAEDLLDIPAFCGTVTIEKKFYSVSTIKKGEYDLAFQAAYQICEDDGTCLLPESISFNRTMLLTDSGIAKSDNSSFLTIVWYIFLAFAGGIILNIMPCVLPLLSVKALNLVEQSNQDKRMIFRSAILYGLGILVSFLVLALTVILLKSSGELFGWGFQFQNPLFVLILISIIFIFALSLFDVYTINAPLQRMEKASKHSAGKSYSSSFFTGIFAVLVATPCTAPFMGAALGFAFSQPPLIIIIIFSFLSLGFALPFILLGLFPQLIKKIPKPGKWMNTFKEFMGFLLLGTVVYLLTSLHSLIGSSIKGVLWFLLFTAIAVWIFGKYGSIIEKKSKRIIVVIISILIISLSAYLFIDLRIQRENSKLEEGPWQEFSSELVEQYRMDNQAVFIDFYADWCTSCKVNDAAVLNTKKIMNLFIEKNVQLLKGDFTAGDREIARWLSDFERAGVPLYILYRPGEEPVVFPEFLTQSMIEKELNLIRP